MILSTAALLLGLQAHALHPGRTAKQAGISDVAVKPEFFNPSLGQNAEILYTVAENGTATVAILDRDRFPVRQLAPIKVEVGKNKATWNGRDDKGDIVPDDAYSVRIELADGGRREVYEPAAGFVPEIKEPKVTAFSARDGVFRYVMPFPGRVHVQAGQATVDPKTKKIYGPVLKVVVDRDPRVAGDIVESWNGFDESGTIYLPDLPDFVMGVLATSLPENSIITVGNRTETALAYARRRRGAPPPRERSGFDVHARHNHSDLNVFEVTSPALSLKPDGKWVEMDQHWIVAPRFKAVVTVNPEQAPYFLNQPTHLTVYLDKETIAEFESPRSPIEIPIAVKKTLRGEHRLAVNWKSKFGPVGVHAVKLVVVR